MFALPIVSLLTLSLENRVQGRVHINACYSARKIATQTFLAYSQSIKSPVKFNRSERRESIRTLGIELLSLASALFFLLVLATLLFLRLLFGKLSELTSCVFIVIFEPPSANILLIITSLVLLVSTSE